MAHEYRDLSARRDPLPPATKPAPPPPSISEDCSKCGWHEADFKYIKPALELEITCLRCGYSWRVKPLDAS